MNTQNQEARLSEIKARCDAATEGPFRVEYGRYELWPQRIVTLSGLYQTIRPEICCFRRDELARVGDAETSHHLATHKEESANAELMAHARADIPFLLETLNRAMTDVAELTGVLRSIEWENDDEEGGKWCPSCKRNKLIGHLSGCGLAAVLSKLGRD